MASYVWLLVVAACWLTVAGNLICWWWRHTPQFASQKSPKMAVMLTYADQKVVKFKEPERQMVVVGAKLLAPEILVTFGI